jgi:tRNA/rRNA methyltransferase
MNSLISIVLVEPENPDNIGAVARAMKNMGLSDLRLVKPPRAWKAKGKKMSMSAYDVLSSAKVFLSLEKAIAGTYLSIATSRRQGYKRGKFISFPEAIKKTAQISQTKKVALVFGKESKGLDNPSLEACDWVTTIPSDDAYPSLNLAQSVMILAFSLFNKRVKIQPSHQELRWVPKQGIMDVLDRIKVALQVLEYREEGNDVIERILSTFHGLFKRNGLLEHEAQMFRGLSRRISERCKKK